jgi:exonuclease SbcC
VIITRLRAAPFGCFPEKEVRFQRGLNVVLGPNEAGKSTLFEALRNVLLLRTRLTKPVHALRVSPYLPVSGGDFIRVEADLETPQGLWRLKRRWGASPASELILPSGAALADDAAIGERLAGILPARPGTVSLVLMTGQVQLAATVHTLKTRAKDSLSDLADILRRAVLETGGVAVDRFMERLAELEQRAYSRWDAAHKGPEGNRGIENPWKNNRGAILEAWYGKEAARASLAAARAYEAGLDEVNGRLRTAAAELARQETFVASHARAARDARERRTLEAELAAVRAEAGILRTVSMQWPVAAHAVEELQKAARVDAAARAPLEKELEGARRMEEGRTLRERHARARRRRTQLEEAERQLAAVPRLESKALDEIRRASSALEKLQAGLDAGRLSVTVAGRAEVRIVVQEDFGHEKRQALGPGETARFHAAGKLRIVHPDMEIEVRSGDVEAEEKMEKASAAQKSLDALLKSHGVADLAQAEEMSRAFEERARAHESAQKLLAEELGAESWESLDARVTGLGAETPTRSVSEIASDLATLKARGEARDAQLEEKRQKVREWETSYGTLEKLVDMHAAARGRETALTERLSASVALPEGFSDAAELLSRFEEAQANLTTLKVDLKGLQVRKEALEKDAPDESAEERAIRTKDAQSVFEVALRRGEALKRLRLLGTSLLEKSNTEVHVGLQQRMQAMVSAMTGGRHARVEMDGSLPRGLDDGAGRSLPWDLLSAGTRDTLALALRLAMASSFLSESDGFLVLDDPLVEMDPDRQKAAALSLQSFAAEKQLIIFTCHPSTAALLGGNLVGL